MKEITRNEIICREHLLIGKVKIDYFYKQLPGFGSHN